MVSPARKLDEFCNIIPPEADIRRRHWHVAMATTLNGRRAKSRVSQGYLSGLSLARRKIETAPPTRMRRR